MKTKHLMITTIFIIGFNLLMFGQSGSVMTTVSIKTLESSINLGLNFIENTQVQFTDSGHFYEGEWKTTMQMDKSFFYLGGKRRKADDSNCFSIASIHNALAQIYLIDSNYTSILDMLDLSFTKVLSYRNRNSFNFWNLLTPNVKLKTDDTIGKQPLVRRPTNFPLKSKYINNAANIADDADDTALGYLAISLHKQIFKDTTCYNTKVLAKDSLVTIFDSYVDLNRNNRHWYNHMRGNDHETGAFLTWLGNEYQINNWNILKTAYHNAIWFHQKSECYPHPYTPYIPYGTNDLDAVVNADILSSLWASNDTNSAAIIDAIFYIEYKSDKNQDKIGLYFPNRYHFSYAVSEAYALGVKKLDTAMINLVEFINTTQNKDGSFSSRRRLNKKDVIQSTAYALNTLINYGHIKKNRTTIRKAISFLLKNSITDDLGMHWEGGVFFSGGTVIRNILLWKSDAYTTAIILKAFVGYKQYLDQNYSVTDSE